MGDKAGIWQRVSTGGQDEASQLPDLVRWCEAHGYEIAERYVVHGKSAYHGGHAAALDRAFGDMAAGRFAVLVVWAADRIERRGALAALQLAERARAAGGRIEYVKDAHLNGANEMSDVMLSLAATMAHQESKRKSERVLAKHDSLRAAGSVVGRAPWGYAIESRGGIKVLVPTATGRKYIPMVFRMVIGGRSLRDVAAWLTGERVPTERDAYVVIGPLRAWHEAYIGSGLIKNQTYYGVRPNSGQLETEALVTYSAWQEAGASLASRVRPGRGTVKHDRSLLSPVCGNPECDATGSDHDSPMYRIFVGRGTGRAPYYRCTGRGPQRRGCGNMVPLAAADQWVTGAMLADQMNMHVERVFVPGDDRSDEIGRLREAAMDAYRRGDKAGFAKMDARADALAALPSVAPHWESRQTSVTNGEYFASLDDAGMRAHIASRYRVTADRDGVVIVPRDWT